MEDKAPQSQPRPVGRIKIATKQTCVKLQATSQRKMQELEQQLGKIRLMEQSLTECNAGLRTKEAMLEFAISQQSAVLFQTFRSELLLHPEMYEDARLVAASQKEEEADQLMKLLGTKAAAQQQYTTQVMQSTATPARLQQISGATVQELAGQLCDITMRMAYRLAAPPCKAELLQGTLESTLDDYGEIIQLSRLVALEQLWTLMAVNLETLQHSAPPLEHWAQVNQGLSLEPQQVQQLLACFKLYTEKRDKLVASMKQHTWQLEQLQLLLQKLLLQQQQQAGMAPPAVAETGSGSSSSDLPASSRSGNDPSNISSDNVTALLAAATAAGMPTGKAAASTSPFDSLRLQQQASAQQEMLVQKIDQEVQLLKNLELFLSYVWINTLSKLQLAKATVLAYPYICKPAALCELLLQQQGNSGGARPPPDPGCANQAMQA